MSYNIKPKKKSRRHHPKELIERGQLHTHDIEMNISIKFYLF